MSTEEHKSVISVDVNQLLSPVSAAIKKIDALTNSFKKLKGKGKMPEAEKSANDVAKSMQKAFSAVKKCSDALGNMRKKAQSANERIRNLIGNLTGLKNTSNTTAMAAKSLAATLGKLVTVGAIVTGIKAAISAGQSSLADAAQFGQVFGGLEEQARKALDSIANEAGSTAFAMRSSFSTIASYAKVTGMDTASALSLSERALRAAADSAAFYDRNLEDVVENLRSYLKGNYENDAALGLASTETTRNTAALRLYGQEFKRLSEDQKVFTLLSQIEEANRLSGALGQAARESGNWSTQIQLLQSRFKELTSIIGSGFIRALTPALQTLNTILGALVDFANAASGVFAQLFGSARTNLAASFADVNIPDGGVGDLADSLGSAADSAQNLASGTKKAADAQKALNAQLMGFDKISKLSSTSASALSGAKGATGGSSSGIGLATSAGSSAAGQSMVAQASAALTDLQKEIKAALDSADFTQFGARVGQKIKDSLDQLNQKWPGIQITVAKIAKSLATFFNGAIEVEGLGSSIGTTLGQAANTGFTAFNTFVGNFHWNSLGFLISNSIYNALVAFDWGQATAAWTNWIAARWQFVAGLIEGINWRSLPVDLFDAAKEALMGIQWGKLLGAGSELAGAIAGAGAGLLVGLFESITNGADKAVTALFTSIGTFFSNAFAGAGENPTLLGVGKNIVLGIFNGISGWLSNVGSWLKTNLLDPFIAGFKNAFGIHSPASNPALLAAAGFVGEGILNGIAAPFRSIAGWVQDHIFTPVKNAISAGVMTATVTLTAVKTAAFDTLAGAWNAVKDKAATWTASVSDKVSSWKAATWDKLSGKATTWTASVSDKVSSWKAATWDKLSGKATTWTASVSDKVSSWKKKTWDALKNTSATFTANLKGSASTGLSSLKKTWDSFSSKTATFTATFKDSFSAGIKSAWNGIATGINSAITTINKIPGVNIKAVPKLATGGITTGATLAEIGEAGREAVLPLDRNTGWMDTLADKIAERSGGGFAQVGQGRPIVVQVVLDGRIVGQSVVDYIHGQGDIGNYPLAGYT